MNWDAAGAIGEIIGAIAVVATLFYLARQVKDSAKQTQMNTLAELVTLYNDSFLPIYNSRENMEIWVRGLEQPDALDEVEREIFFLFYRRLINPYAAAARQHREGVLDAETFEFYRAFTANLAQSPGAAAFREAHAEELMDPESARLLGLQSQS